MNSEKMVKISNFKQKKPRSYFELLGYTLYLSLFDVAYRSHIHH